MFILSSLLLLLLGLVWNRWAPSRIFAGWVLLALGLGWTSPEQVLQNFANPQLATLVLLVLLAQALERMGFWEKILVRLCRNGALSFWRLGSVVALLSAVVNNTAVVAASIGPLVRQQEGKARVLLLPVSYASLLGGMLTLVGTSTNLILSGLALQAGLPPLQFDDFWQVGLPTALLGVGMLAWLAPRLLSSAPAASAHPATEIGAIVQTNSPLCGRSISENGLRHLQHLFLAEILRGEQALRPVHPQERIEPGDQLLFVGNLEEVQELQQIPGLQLLSGTLQPKDDTIEQVVIAPGSPLIGRTLPEIEFRSRFDAAVLSIQRGPESLHGKLGKQRLVAGDELTLVTGPDFLQRNNLERNFLRLQQIPLRKGLSPVASASLGLGLLLVLSLALLEWLSLLTGLMLLLGLSLTCGWVTTGQLRRRFPFELLIIVGSALTLAQVLRGDEALPAIIRGLQGSVGLESTLGGLCFCFGLAWVLTELVTNNAAAAIAFPFVLETAALFHTDPFPFLLALAFGASASFLSPYGYQTHLLVRSPGGYGWSDFLRLGLPLLLVYTGTSLGMIWWLYL